MNFDELMDILTGDGEKPETIYDDIRNSYADVQTQLSDATESSNALAQQIAEKDGRIQELEGEVAKLQASNDDLFSKIPADDPETNDDKIGGIDDLFEDKDDA